MDPETAATDPQPPPAPNRPDPESRALDGCSGVPVAMADGREWMLGFGGLLNGLDGLRDRLDDSARATGQVAMADIHEVAWLLLMANYSLTFPEAASLTMDAPPEGLVEGVKRALYGRERGTYTSWVASALIANGIDPAAVPTDLVPEVMEHLVATSRAIPAEKFIRSALESAELARFRRMAQLHSQSATAGPPGPAVVISGPGAV